MIPPTETFTRWFRDELATHIRESSFPVGTSSERQWIADEELRDVYYDLSGPSRCLVTRTPFDDESWGRHRLTAYMLDGIGTNEATASDGATSWLAA